MLYQIRKAVRKLWRGFLEQLDEAGFGEPVREFWGRLVAELTGKTGERGKGIDFLQTGYLCGAVILTIRQLWTPGWAISYVVAGFVVFPFLRRGITRLCRKLLHMAEVPKEVYWVAKIPQSTLPHPSVAVFQLTVGQQLRQLARRFRR